MKSLDNMNDIMLTAELIELVETNYDIISRMSFCATLIEGIANETGTPIGKIYDELKGVAMIINGAA